MVMTDSPARALDLVALADLTREAAHGRSDALDLHDGARSIEAAANRLLKIEARATWQKPRR